MIHLELHASTKVEPMKEFARRKLPAIAEQDLEKEKREKDEDRRPMLT